MSDYIDNYKLLANAIVIQAATDWRDACSLMDKAPYGSKDYMRGDYIRKQCETFFRSAWCGELTKLDGIYILERLKRSIKNEQNFLTWTYDSGTGNKDD